jgi:hypothetical protein
MSLCNATGLLESHQSASTLSLGRFSLPDISRIVRRAAALLANFTRLSALKLFL